MNEGSEDQMLVGGGIKSALYVFKTKQEIERV